MLTPGTSSTRHRHLTVPSAEARRRPVAGLSRVGWVVVLLVALVGLGWAIYAISRGMRGVLAVGGGCGDSDDGDYLPPCPDGVISSMMLGIFGGLIASGLSALAAHRLRIPQLGLLGWPALFGVLGWNFLDFARVTQPDPGSSNGTWLFCGVLFIAMAVVPGLVIVAMLVRMPRRFARSSRRSEEIEPHQAIHETSGQMSETNRITRMNVSREDRFGMTAFDPDNR